jgi:hypothetical protein
MKRQGLTTTINELVDISRKLFEEVDIDNEDFMNTKVQLNIINKKGLSDTWEFEK